jgi:hypothetical protein
MNSSALRVTVFGGSSPRPGEPAYQQALELGTLLGQAGYTVLTGDYIGTMEAVSRGAAEAGGHVIGITCNEIESWRPVGPNPWVQEQMRFPTLRERLYALIENCDAALALPGGIGTLAEISVMWAHLHSRLINQRPLILIGQGWQKVFQDIFQLFEAYISPDDPSLITFARDHTQAFDLLQSLTNNPL